MYRLVIVLSNSLALVVVVLINSLALHLHLHLQLGLITRVSDMMIVLEDLDGSNDKCQQQQQQQQYQQPLDTRTRASVDASTHRPLSEIAFSGTHARVDLP